MLILTSDGLSSPSLRLRASAHLSGKRCALVTTASIGYKALDRHVPRLKEDLLACGVRDAVCFDFDEQSPDELSSYDAALLIGGNPFYLLHSIRTHGYTEALHTLSRSGTLMGVSAGTAVLTPSIGILAQYTPEMNQSVGLDDLAGLSLFPQEILPHYSKFLTRFEHFEERAQAYEHKNGVSLLRLNDGEAVFSRC